MTIEHINHLRRFQFQEESLAAHLHYNRVNETLVILATFVPPKMRDRGIGRSLAQAALDYAREQALEVVPTCPFVKKLLDRGELQR